MKLKNVFIVTLLLSLMVLLAIQPIISSITAYEKNNQFAKNPVSFSGEIEYFRNRMNIDYLPFIHKSQQYVEVRDLATFRTIYHIDYDDLDMPGYNITPSYFYDNGVLFVCECFDEENEVEKIAVYKKYSGEIFKTTLPTNLGFFWTKHVVDGEKPIFIISSGYKINAVQGEQTIWTKECRGIEYISGDYIWVENPIKSDYYCSMLDIRTGTELAGYNMTLHEANDKISQYSEKQEDGSYDYVFVNNSTTNEFYRYEDVLYDKDKTITIFLHEDNVILIENIGEDYVAETAKCTVSLINTDDGVLLNNTFSIGPLNSECAGRKASKNRYGGVGISHYYLEANDKYIAISVRCQDREFGKSFIYDYRSGHKVFETDLHSNTDENDRYLFGKYFVIYHNCYISMYDFIDGRCIWSIDRTPVDFQVTYEDYHYYVYNYYPPLYGEWKSAVYVENLTTDKVEPFDYRFDFYVEEGDVIPTKYGLVILADKLYLFKPGVQDPHYHRNGIDNRDIVIPELQENGDYLKLSYFYCDEERFVWYLEIETGRILYSEEAYQEWINNGM